MVAFGIALEDLSVDCTWLHRDDTDPEPADLTASAQLNASSADFDAAWHAWFGQANSGLRIVMLTMAPLRRSRIDGRTARMERCAPNWFVSNISRFSSSGVSSNGPPALILSLWKVSRST